MNNLGTTFLEAIQTNSGEWDVFGGHKTRCGIQRLMNITARCFKFAGCIMAQILFSALSASAVVLPSPTVTLMWDYPAEELGTNLIFKIYHSTDPTLPAMAWPELTNVIGTNLSVSLPMESGAHFFTLTASNSAGESAFATVSP